MKKILLGMCFVMAVFANVAASDYIYTETESVTTWERADYVSDNCGQRFYSSRDVRPIARPCEVRPVAAEPVRVKTHTEVIDHYQVYQPVTVYKPMGTQIQRRIVPVPVCESCK